MILKKLQIHQEDNYIKKTSDNIYLNDSSIVNNRSLQILQTIDHIKLFSSLNPFDFGKISYLHSQNDILAAGGEVKSLSVSLSVPFSENSVEKFYLEYFMEGIKFEADKSDCVISSGHSYQSKEPGITLTLNGEIKSNVSKNSAKKGDLIYLSKPLGTGYLIAAYFNNSEMLSIGDFKKILNNLNLETFVITNYTSHLKEVDKSNNVEFISDAQPFDGPLTCIEQIFSSFKKTTKNIIIVPVDMPNLNTKLIYSLFKSWEENQNFALISHDGIFTQPLFGIYPINKENHFKLKKKLSSGKKNFLGWVDQIPHKYFYAKNGDLININSKREFLNMNNGI